MAIRNWMEAARAGWLKRGGLSKNLDYDYAYDRDFIPKWANPTAGGPDIMGPGVDPTGNVTIGGPGALAIQPMLVPAVYTLDPNAALVDQVFYIANQAMRVISISEVHTVAGSSTPTAVIKKCIPGQTIVQGTALQTGSFNLAATAMTQQNAVLSTNVSVLTLAAGDRLAIDYTGTMTTLSGVCVTVWLQPLVSPTLDVTFTWNANAQLIDSAFFIANERYVVTAARWAHSTAATTGGAANVQLVKDTSTNAPGAGTDMLTNNANAGFDCKGTINVPQVGTLVATAATLLMAVGDRLSVDFSVAPTSLVGVVLTVSLTPIAGRLEVPFYLPSTWAANTDQTFFISDGAYKAICEQQVHAVAAGGVSTAMTTKDVGTNGPGVGADLLTAANDLNATANTVQTNLLLTTLGLVNIRSADRLAYDFANAVQASSGLVVTVSLQRI